MRGKQNPGADSTARGVIGTGDTQEQRQPNRFTRRRQDPPLVWDFRWRVRCYRCWLGDTETERADASYFEIHRDRDYRVRLCSLDEVAQLRVFSYPLLPEAEVLDHWLVCSVSRELGRRQFFHPVLGELLRLFRRSPGRELGEDVARRIWMRAV
jgi:hypothetical protein